MRTAELFNYFRGYALTAVCFNSSRWLEKVDRLSDDKPLRMSAAIARFTPMTILFTLVLCWAVLGACAGKRRTEPPPDEELRVAIEENVQDEKRRAELLSFSEQFSRILEELVAATNETSQELDQLLIDYDSDRESFERTFEHYNQKRQALSKRTIALHFEIKTLTTPAEWTAIEAAMLQLASSQIAVRLHRR